MGNVHIRERQPDDDAEVVAMFNRITPEFPPTTVEELRFQIEHGEPGMRSLYLVATEDDRVAGAGGLFEIRHPESRPFFALVAVDPDSRRHGIGAALYDRLIQQAAPWRAERLIGDVLEHHEDGLAFARARGFEETGHGEQHSRLDVAAADLERFKGVEDRLADRGIVIRVLAELPLEDDAFMATVHEAAMESRRDIPGAEPQEPSPFDTWRELVLHGSGRSAGWYWVALDGNKPVGVAALKRAGEDCGWNSYTGVLREYRGLGVARALKLRTVEWCRANGVRHLYTGNEVANHPMLAINRDLGYQPLPRSITMRKVLDGSLGEGRPPATG